MGLIDYDSRSTSESNSRANSMHFPDDSTLFSEHFTGSARVFDHLKPITFPEASISCVIMQPCHARENHERCVLPLS